MGRATEQDGRAASYRRTRACCTQTHMVVTSLVRVRVCARMCACADVRNQALSRGCFCRRRVQLL